MAVDVRTGEERMLIENARIGEIVVNPVDHSLMGVRHANGLATLVRIPSPYDDWYEVHTFPYEDVPSDLDISPDGRLLSGSVGEVNGDQFLRVWELDKILNRRRETALRVPVRAIRPGELRISRDGRYLYGSSYYTGVSNIFRYEVATGDSRSGFECRNRLLPPSAARRRPAASC